MTPRSHLSRGLSERPEDRGRDRREIVPLSSREGQARGRAVDRGPHGRAASGDSHPGRTEEQPMDREPQRRTARWRANIASQGTGNGQFPQDRGPVNARNGSIALWRRVLATKMEPWQQSPTGCRQRFRTLPRG